MDAHICSKCIIKWSAIFTLNIRWWLPLGSKENGTRKENGGNFNFKVLILITEKQELKEIRYYANNYSF